jgi:ABC-2 type transport system ATP-binding protein
MSVAGFLGFCAEVRGLHGAAKRSAVSRVLELCFLEKVRHQSVDTLSKGYRHRTCFAQSIIHDPEVLILDEPTDGLDPNQKQVVRDMIKHMGENKAIIFSTHILEEVEAACSRAMIIDQGKVVADGTPAELKAKAPNAGSIVALIHGLPAGELKANLARLGNVKEITELDGGALRLRPKHLNQGEGLSQEIFRFCTERRLTLTSLKTEEGRLDDLFSQLTQTVE